MWFCVCFKEQTDRCGVPVSRVKLSAAQLDSGHGVNISTLSSLVSRERQHSTTTYPLARECLVCSARLLGVLCSSMGSGTIWEFPARNARFPGHMRPVGQPQSYRSDHLRGKLSDEIAAIEKNRRFLRNAQPKPYVVPARLLLLHFIGQTIRRFKDLERRVSSLKRVLQCIG
jgi:hypothetical protein